MRELTITDVRALPGDSAFLIDDGETSILYDSGFGFTGYQVADNIQNVLGERPLDYIFLTHSHYDHALGSACVRRRYPGARVVASGYAQKIFAKPSARALMRELDRKAAAAYGVTEYEDLTGELQVDLPVEDADTVDCGRMRFAVAALPGHTKCSVGFYLKEERLLLGTETLGVYFGQGTYLPSYLVGYQMTLDSLEKAERLSPERILLPHYGLVHGEEARSYLQNARQTALEAAGNIKKMLLSGKTREEILAYLTETTYRENVRPTYPIDAFQLNTLIMIDLIRKELADA